MALYWSYNSVPELAALPKARRKQIWRECKNLKTAPWWVLLIVFLAWVACPFLLILLNLPSRYHHWEGVIGGVWMFVLIAFSNHFKIARLLPEIRKRVGGLCRNCGYDIRATPDTLHCPECGENPYE